MLAVKKAYKHYNSAQKQQSFQCRTLPKYDISGPAKLAASIVEKLIVKVYVLYSTSHATLPPTPMIR